MTPVSHILSLPGNNSFIAQSINTSALQTGLHQHMEHELILFIQGSGIAYIGEYQGKVEPGDIYFIGSNLPHVFKSGSPRPVSAIMIQFRDNCWGNHFINMPECNAIKQLLETAANGLQITGNSKYNLELLIKTLATTTGINRIIGLLQCLEIMSEAREYTILSKKKAQGMIYKNGDPIDKIVEFTLAYCHNHISLSQVAGLACMSVSSFSHYFKRRTQKTYTDFLNEVRIGYACEQLLQTNKPVTDIGYESGYNTVAYFHRQFLRIKKITPLQFRKKETANKNSEIKNEKVSTIVNV